MEDLVRKYGHFKLDALRLAYQKSTLRTKIEGALGYGSIQKIWDPVRISATVEDSNFKFGTQQLFWDFLTKKQRLGPKLAGAWARGASGKIWDPLFISATD